MWLRAVYSQSMTLLYHMRDPHQTFGLNRANAVLKASKRRINNSKLSLQLDEKLLKRTSDLLNRGMLSNKLVAASASIAFLIQALLFR